MRGIATDEGSMHGIPPRIAELGKLLLQASPRREG
jgi:hypothetical protein